MSKTSSAETVDLQARAIAHTLRPMSAQDEAAGDMPTVVTRGEGVYIFDSNGQRMLDCVGGLWCVNTGYGRAEL